MEDNKKNAAFSYEMHEMAHFALAPARAVADVTRTWLESPIDPLSLTAAGRNLAATAKIFERLTRRYGKPAFDLATTVVDGKIVPIVEVVVWSGRFASFSILKRGLTPESPSRGKSF